MKTRHTIRWILTVCCAAAVLACSSCDDDDENFHHTPPAGMGSLVVDNNTDNHIAVYIDGRAVAEAREDHHQIYDLEPGEHRVALDEQGGDRREGFDVDILENRLTILDVQPGADLRDYDIFVRFD